MRKMNDPIGKTNEQIYREAWLASMQAVGHREQCAACKTGQNCETMVRLREPVYEATELEALKIEAQEPINWTKFNLLLEQSSLGSPDVKRAIAATVLARDERLTGMPEEQRDWDNDEDATRPPLSRRDPHEPPPYPPSALEWI